VDAKIIETSTFTKSTTPTSEFMAAIGSLVFCTGCGNLLDSANGDENVVLTCDVCGARCKGMVFKILYIPVLFFLYTRAGKTWEETA
jgi:hypothetical protein